MLGVEELPDKSLRPVGLKDPEKMIVDFWTIINNQNKVNLNILTDRYVQIVQAGDHRVVVIEVPCADRREKPIYIGVDPFSGTYRRNNEGDYHYTKNEVRNMMRDQSEISQDMKVLDDLGLDAFDYESILRYRNRLKIHRPSHVWENLENTELLKKLGCIGRDADGILHPTAAGILMFGQENEIIKEFPYYFLDYQEHENENTRWTDRILSNLGDWSGTNSTFFPA